MAEARIFYQQDCNLSLLDGKTIAIIGYGSQGHAHALNLKDSGCHVIIGLYEGSKSWKRADEQGCEVFSAGVGALAKRLDEMSLSNVRIIQHDAVDVVKNMLAADSLDGVHIYFPDPWRKARHHKRRLVAQPFIHELVQRIKPGGYIHCATDWENYAQQMLEVLQTEPLLENFYDDYSPVMANPITERPMTKFHARGERLGHGVWDLVFKRR